MADLSILAGATSQSVNLFIQNSTKGDGSGLTGLVFNTASLTAYYSFTGANATAVVISLVTLATITTAYASGGFKEIDATNMPGWYRLDLPNAAIATAKGRVCNLHLQGAANMAPKVYTIELTAVDNQSTAFGLVLAKTTNITGFNDITAAAAATGVWQDATAGDFTVASSIGKALYIANIAPGGSGGHMISGSNAGTTTLAALTVTGNTTLSDGLLVSRTTGNSSAITATGTGTGSGIVATSGAGATGDGIQATAGSTNGNGLSLTKTGSGNALNATTTNLVLAKTTNITGFNDITAAAAATGVWQDATAGDFTVASSIGKSLYTSGVVPGASGGLFIAGSNAATTVNITGTLSTVTNLTNAPTAGDFTATMKTSLNAATPTASIGTGGITSASFAAGAINAASINADTGLILRANTATAAAAASLTLDAGATTTVDYYKDCWLIITSSTGIGQARRISTYSAGRVASVSPAWATTPSATSTYAILPSGRVDLDAILGTASAGAAGSVGIDWAQVANPGSTVNLSATTTNLVNTATNLTNAPTNGDFTAAMKTSLNNSTPASITGAVGSVTGNVGGNVVGSVGSVTGNVGGNVTGSVGSVTAAVTVGAVNSSAVNLKKNTAFNNFQFVMVDSSGIPKTGLTVSATRSIDGAGFSACANAVTEISNGWYTINLANTDLNGNDIAFRMTATGAADLDFSVVTSP